MLMTDYTAEFLNLEDVIITNVENIADQLHIHIELPRRNHVCPCCGSVTDRVHDYRLQVIKDVPMARDTFLHLRKRRYRCDCGKRFFEKNTFLPRYYRVTSRLVSEIIFAFKKVVSATEIGCRFNVSSMTAMRYFQHYNHNPTTLPKVISLDEFKGNSGGQKYNSIVADPSGRKVLDILPDRYENNLVKYFSRFESKSNVKYLEKEENHGIRPPVLCLGLAPQDPPASPLHSVTSSHSNLCAIGGFIPIVRLIPSLSEHRVTSSHSDFIRHRGTCPAKRQSLGILCTKKGREKSLPFRSIVFNRLCFVFR